MNIHKVIEENWKLNVKGKDIAINGKIYTLTISKDLDSIMNYLYDDATIYLDRKYEKYNTYLSLKKI